MIAEETRSLVSKAKKIYESIHESLESDHKGKFIAIEPESQEFFIANTFDEAVKAARKAHPNRVTHTIRVGHQAAFHIGLMEQ